MPGHQEGISYVCANWTDEMSFSSGICVWTMVWPTKWFLRLYLPDFDPVGHLLASWHSDVAAIATSCRVPLFMRGQYRKPQETCYIACTTMFACFREGRSGTSEGLLGIAQYLYALAISCIYIYSSSVFMLCS